MFVPPGQSNTVTQDKLEVQDPDNAPEELVYTLVTPTNNGTLYFNGQPLTSGSTFRQSTINANNLWYTHDGSDSQLDKFTFTVNDGTGGWIPSQQFNIKVDENAIVGTEEVSAADDILVFPNPTSGMINVAFKKSLEEMVVLRLINVQGQEVLRREFEQFGEMLQINASNLPGGIYLVNLQTKNQVFGKKVIIQH